MAPKYQDEVSAWATEKNFNDPLQIDGFDDKVPNPKLDKKNMSKKN